MTQSSQKGHPKGLYLLFTVEMWERMSYYGMRALLTLYMTAKTTELNPGFGMSTTDALKIYAWYTGLVYATPLLGGFLADRYLGQRRSVYIGGILMMIGHFLMAVPGLAVFYSALIFLIIGNGFFKPNISTMVGGLYEEGDSRRDSAFTIFYMGINLGAVLAGLICGSLGEKIGYHWGFGAAGVGMALGLIIFWIFEARTLPKDLGVLVRSDQESAEGGQDQNHEPLTREEVDRITVIFILSIFVMFFWAAFEQAGGLMNIYTKEKVDRVIWGFEVPASWFQSLNPAIIFLFAPIFSKLWSKLGEKGIDPPTPVKMAAGLILLSLGFVFMLHGVNQADAGHNGLAAIFWLTGAYFWHTMGELCLSPIGLSMVTKLAPARLAALMMGVWLGSNFIANLAAGYIGGYSERLGEFELFSYIIFGTSGAGVVLFFFARPIITKMHTPAEENPIYSAKMLVVVGMLLAAAFYVYPQYLNTVRAEDGFKCTQSQREAKANFYRLITAQKTYYSEEKAKKKGTESFTDEIKALKLSFMPEEIDYTQRLALNLLGEIVNTQNTYKEKKKQFAKSLDELELFAESEKTSSGAESAHHKHKYTFTLSQSEEGYTVDAIRNPDHPSEDGRDLKGDHWRVNQDGVISAQSGQLTYAYTLTKADKKMFTATARSVRGEGDEWTLEYQLGEIRGEMKNPTNRCASK